MLETFVVEWALGPTKSGPDSEDTVVGPGQGPVTPEGVVDPAAGVLVGESPTTPPSLEVRRSSRQLTL